MKRELYEGIEGKRKVRKWMDCVWIDFGWGKERKRKEKEMDGLCFAQTSFPYKSRRKQRERKSS